MRSFIFINVIYHLYIIKLYYQFYVCYTISKFFNVKYTSISVRTLCVTYLHVYLAYTYIHFNV